MFLDGKHPQNLIDVSNSETYFVADKDYIFWRVIGRGRLGFGDPDSSWSSTTCLEAYLDINTVSLDGRSKCRSLTASSEFRNALEHLAHFGGPIDRIVSQWEISDLAATPERLRAMDTNLALFNHATRGINPNDRAALEEALTTSTWTGRLAKNCGFDRAHFVELEGAPGEFNRVVVWFHRSDTTSISAEPASSPLKEPEEQFLEKCTGPVWDNLQDVERSGLAAVPGVLRAEYSGQSRLPTLDRKRIAQLEEPIAESNELLHAEFARCTHDCGGELSAHTVRAFNDIGEVIQRMRSRLEIVKKTFGAGPRRSWPWQSALRGCSSFPSINRTPVSTFGSRADPLSVGDSHSHAGVGIG